MSFNSYVKETLQKSAVVNRTLGQGRPAFGILQFISEVLIHTGTLWPSALLHSASSSRFPSLSFFHSQNHRGRASGCLSVKKNDHFSKSFFMQPQGVQASIEGGSTEFWIENLFNENANQQSLPSRWRTERKFREIPHPLKNGPFWAGEMGREVWELDMSLSLESLAIYVLNTFRWPFGSRQ